MSGRLVPLLGSLAARVYRTYYGTLELRGMHPDGRVIRPQEYPFGREIFAMCERDALALGGMIASTRVTVLLALGRDGDWAGPILQRLGFGVVRGSSLHGGAKALAGLIRAMRSSQHPGAIVVDGPVGPSGVAKQGVVLCAMHTGRPIRALGVAARRAVTFRRTWSKIFLPLPFTRVAIAGDEPTPVPAHASRGEIEGTVHQLTERLAWVRRRALDAISAWDRQRLPHPGELKPHAAADETVRLMEQRP